MTDDATIQALRQAIALVPDNIGLVEHLCRLLIKLGRLAEAEAEYREALQRAPGRWELALGLAETYDLQGKRSHALAITETAVGRPDPPPAALVLHARLLFQAGDAPGAVAHYKRAVNADPGAADPELSALLGWCPADADDRGPGKLRAPAHGDYDHGHFDPPDDDDDDDGDTAGGGGGGAVERPAISFADVGGMEALKEEIRVKIIYPLRHPEVYAAYGKAAGGGVLLYGPPGCGKTHLARATAGEVKAGFLSVGINDVLDMWLGNSERNLHDLFERARRSRPCVLFFDEVDALGASRSDMRQSSSRHLINQFLAELDGPDSSNEGLLVLGATNAPWHVDNAFRRPGRFDRVLFVPPPDAPSRAQILEVLLRGKPLAEMDVTRVAAKTEAYSGADLRAVVDAAVEQKLREAVKTGKPTPLTTRDLLDAAGRTRPSTREWLATARNHALYSNQGGAYDEILDYLKIKKP